MKIQIVCQYCEASALKKHSKAKYCSNACKQASYRQRNQSPALSIQSIETQLISSLNKLENIMSSAAKKEEALGILNRVDGHLEDVGLKIQGKERNVRTTRIRSTEELEEFKKDRRL